MICTIALFLSVYHRIVSKSCSRTFGLVFNAPSLFVSANSFSAHSPPPFTAGKNMLTNGSELNT
jgi:hypothetical protein